MVKKGIVYGCSSNESYGNRKPFEFLNEINKRFESMFQIETASDWSNGALNSAFRKVIKNQLEHTFNSDSVNNAKQKLSTLRGRIDDSLSATLQRGEDIDTMQSKADGLEHNAQMFQGSSKKLKNAMCIRNLLLIALLLFIVSLVTFVVVWLLCGIPTFSRCADLFKKITDNNDEN
mmetsp:Transcript_6540/g.9508  ORF Transcript_6540/g.9508 Transcript_6540/m.9508 type:complete len:176 (+) Transcript_6540:89-616(+)